MEECYNQFIIRLTSALENDNSGFSEMNKSDILSFVEEFENIRKDRDLTEYELKSMPLLVSCIIAVKLFYYLKQILLKYYSNRILRNDKYVFTSDMLEEYKKTIPIYTKKELFSILMLIDDTSVRRIINNISNANFDKLYYCLKAKDEKTFLSMLEGVSPNNLTDWVIEELFSSQKFKDNIDNVLRDFINRGQLEIALLMVPNVANFVAFSQEIDEKVPDRTICEELLKLCPPAIIEIKQNIDRTLASKFMSKRDRHKFSEVLQRYEFIYECIDFSQPIETPEEFNITFIEMLEIIKKTFNSLKQPVKEEMCQVSKQSSSCAKTAESLISESEFDKFLNDNFEILDSERKRFNLNYKGNLLSFINLSTDKKAFETLCFILYPNYTVKGSGKDYFKGKIKHLQGNFSWIQEPNNNMDCAKRICKYFPKFNDCIKDKENFTYSQNKLKGIIAKLVVEDEISWIESFIRDYWAIQPEGNIFKTCPRKDFLKEINDRRNSINK